MSVKAESWLGLNLAWYYYIEKQACFYTVSLL